MRVQISADPFLPMNTNKPWREQGNWPAKWVGCRDAFQPPFVAAFRLKFQVAHQELVRLHVSADERYELYLDGERLGRGPERGAPDNWFYETYDISLKRGRHVLVAKVWALGELAPDAQMSSPPGFLLAAEGAWGERLNTGVADWEAKPLTGFSFHQADLMPWRGARVSVQGEVFSWGFERGIGRGWSGAIPLGPARGRWTDWSFYRDHLLKPAGLPPMQEGLLPPGQVRHVQNFIGERDKRRNEPVRMVDHLSDEAEAWVALWAGRGKVVIPPHTGRRVILELADYSIAYPQLRVTGGRGSTIEVQWAEALKLNPEPMRHDKGHRGEIEGKYFIGNGDCFFPDGGENRLFEPLWWMAGRFVEIYLETADEPLEIRALQFLERRYPLSMVSQFNCSDSRLVEMVPILLRGMQMCSNETFFDCPYYEEMMYTGDTRLESLVTLILSRDDRLVRKALRLFDASRLANGLTQSRFPCRPTQVISPFALWWVGMVHDFLYWRDDLELVRELLPGVRATIQGFQRWIGSDYLLRGPEGWNTIDWVPAWDRDAGVPPDGHSGISGVLNWQYIYALALYEDLEHRVGDPEMAAWALRARLKAAKAALEAFWDEGRGLLADDLAKKHFSEHSQVLALLSSSLPKEKESRLVEGLFSDPVLDRTTIYFSHYYFEVCRKYDRMDAFFERMKLWFYLKEMGFKTPVESPEPSRSDCHAWSSHPLFHYFATLLGVRPTAPGFREVEIAPHMGSLRWVKGSFPHPAGGKISVECEVEGNHLRARVEIPEGVSGVFAWKGTRQRLTPPKDELILER